MKVLLSVLLALAVIVLHFGPGLRADQQSAKFPIQVYYESLCPDSVRFVQQQLRPNYEELKDYIDILFVPFGKSASKTNSDKSVSFTCQHGPEECVGNRIQSCVLNTLAMAGHVDAQTEFVACQMKFSAEPSGVTCANRVGVPEEAVSDCFEGAIGTQLQLEAEILTKVISPSFVPTIVYNWNFDQRLQDRSLRNFRQVVCEQIGNIAPACK